MFRNFSLFPSLRWLLQVYAPWERHIFAFPDNGLCRVLQVFFTSKISFCKLKAVRLWLLSVGPPGLIPDDFMEHFWCTLWHRRRRVVSKFLQFSLQITIPPLFHTYLRVSPSPEVCDSRVHAAHYHILGI
jgi:hypothetical protein